MFTKYERSMYEEACNYIRAAEILVRKIASTGNAAPMLNVLGMEILLKCALRVSGVKYARKHDYYDLWKSLPKQAQLDILEAANQRIPAYVDLDDIEGLMKAYKKIFMKTRYSYEVYEGNIEDKAKKGKEWVVAGCPLEDADFVFYPEELTCIIYGLTTYLDTHLYRA